MGSVPGGALWAVLAHETSREGRIHAGWGPLMLRLPSCVASPAGGDLSTYMCRSNAHVSTYIHPYSNIYLGREVVSSRASRQSQPRRRRVNPGEPL